MEKVASLERDPAPILKYVRFPEDWGAPTDHSNVPYQRMWTCRQNSKAKKTKDDTS